MADRRRWDIFCKIVDNFGDIGVCLRLARQLQVEHGLQVRLWIDDLSAAKQIIPALDVAQQTQVIQHITIAAWQQDTVFNEIADVVIETFSCELPSTYLTLMQPDTVWVNLEYLSAESWVDDFHAKPSPQPNNLTRHFYFPGFTETTGGLIRERDVVKKNQLFTNDKQLQSEFWQSLNLNNSYNLKISLFCYSHVPIHDFLTAMAESSRLIDCYVPASGILPQIASFFGKESMSVGENLIHKNLHLHVLPFLSQTDYDKLLSACDINFVRGEDSWLRAIWAGRPFIWQPYFQDENTHIKKLDAFLDLFYAGFDKKQVVCEAHHCWVAGHMPNIIWQSYINNLQAIQIFTNQQTNQIGKTSRPCI